MNYELPERLPKAMLWVDLESGTYGHADNIRVITIFEQDIDWWNELTDSDRVRIARNTGLEVASEGEE